MAEVLAGERRNRETFDAKGLIVVPYTIEYSPDVEEHGHVLTAKPCPRVRTQPFLP